MSRGEELTTPKQGDTSEDLEGMPTRASKAPLNCKETLCEGDGWRSVIMARNDYYTAALNKREVYTCGVRRGGAKST